MIPGESNSWEYATPGVSILGVSSSRGVRLPGSMLLPGGQAPREYAPPGESKFSNLHSANWFKIFGLIPGRSILPGSQSPGVCSYQGADPREEHTPGESDYREEHTLGESESWEEQTPGSLFKFE